jgi:hypothetical protein
MSPHRRRLGVNMDNMRADDLELKGSLRALAAEDAVQGASGAVRMRLLEEVRLIRRGRRRAVVRIYILAGGLCVAAALPIWYVAKADLRDPLSAARTLPAAPDAEMVTAFFPLPYSTVPMSGVRLLRLKLPRETVRALGVNEATGDSSSDLVLADVLVGEDGLARAVRFVRPLPRDQQRKHR